jgi:hypothetical protein
VWAETKGYTLEQMKDMSEKEIMDLVAQSPYYKATAADTDYIKKVELQGSVQKWVDHSISVTVNLPANITVHLKTGSLTGVRAFAGYIDAANGDRLAFAIICNNFNCAPSIANEKLSVILRKIATLY